ncbi:entericidin [Bordetella genomosp. 13]|uniref:Entericidin n=1 Tax=Bordetella genomosp. 13 TaxID=463040 RepID=A0A1W6ZIP0_9BORD|nr:entericidin A/B family lipoprotein [Bordetella genomosp. 13]ARP97172.1 entericidin [Bordetella genomosp. 13]
MKHSRKWLVAMMAVAAMVAGCNTMEGAGKDIERGGEKIQEGAR